MGILDITNRTENWKTVQHFYGLDHNAKVRLVTELGEPKGIRAMDIQIELFWKGMRDFLYESDIENQLARSDLAERYRCLFPQLREKLKGFRGFQLKWDDSHYSVHSDEGKLFNNLRNTEIDIVLQTPKYLFIGEAKGESPFDAKSKYVLVHQLVRQYVMAKVLVDLSESKKCVVPFVVGDKDKMESIRNTTQIKFMICQGWLNDKNILSWDCIGEIVKREAASN